MKLFEEFHPVSKEQWLEKVTTDLKGRKDIDDLSQGTVGSEVISPFYHKDDITQSIDIPDSSITQALLGIEIVITDDIKGNQLILESLEGGANFLFLKIKNEIPDFETLFSDVLLDLIRVVIEFDDQEAIELCRAYITQKYKQPLSDFSIYGDDCHFISLEGDIENSLVNLLSEGSDVISKRQIQEPVYFQLAIGHNYIENICAIRASRLLWANLLEAHGYAHDHVELVVVCSVSRDILSSIHYDNMISLTQMSMSAMSAGTDVIMLPPSDVLDTADGKEDTRRISRNIYNLMTMEAYMHKVQSPAAGSYLFDKVSSDLALKSWNQFIKKIQS